MDLTLNFQPIEDHPGDTKECWIAVIHNGNVECIDRGQFEPGDIREEWDEVEDGVSVKLYEEQEDGYWHSNYGHVEDPTHFAALKALTEE